MAKLLIEVNTDLKDDIEKAHTILDALEAYENEDTDTNNDNETEDEDNELEGKSEEYTETGEEELPEDLDEVLDDED